MKACELKSNLRMFEPMLGPFFEQFTRTSQYEIAESVSKCAVDNVEVLTCKLRGDWLAQLQTAVAHAIQHQLILVAVFRTVNAACAGYIPEAFL